MAWRTFVTHPRRHPRPLPLPRASQRIRGALRDADLNRALADAQITQLKVIWMLGDGQHRGAEKLTPALLLTLSRRKRLGRWHIVTAQQTKKTAISQ